AVGGAPGSDAAGESAGEISAKAEAGQVAEIEIDVGIAGQGKSAARSRIDPVHRGLVKIGEGEVGEPRLDGDGAITRSDICGRFKVGMITVVADAGGDVNGTGADI